MVIRDKSVSLQLWKNENFAGKLDIKMTAHVRNAGLGDRVEGIPTRIDGYGYNAQLQV